MIRENGLGITNRSQLLKTHFLSAEVMVGKMGIPENCAIISSPGLTIPNGPIGTVDDMTDFVTFMSQCFNFS